MPVRRSSVTDPNELVDYMAGQAKLARIGVRCPLARGEDQIDATVDQIHGSRTAIKQKPANRPVNALKRRMANAPVREHL
ncbi:MAG TPA: hypothetical protein VGR43_03315 [Dehalococcoidia bacterium]|jgi:hypothetical protein|nr:hypothetical protein [Dehalococcoidia bacterium]